MSKDKDNQAVTLSRAEFMQAYCGTANLSYHGWDGNVKTFSSKDIEALYQSLQGQTMPLVFNDLTDFVAKVKN